MFVFVFLFYYRNSTIQQVIKDVDMIKLFMKCHTWRTEIDQVLHDNSVLSEEHLSS